MGKFFKCSTILQVYVAVLFMLSALSMRTLVMSDDIFWLYIASR